MPPKKRIIREFLPDTWEEPEQFTNPTQDSAILDPSPKGKQKDNKQGANSVHQSGMPLAPIVVQRTQTPMASAEEEIDVICATRTAPRRRKELTPHNTPLAQRSPRRASNENVIAPPSIVNSPTPRRPQSEQKPVPALQTPAGAAGTTVLVWRQLAKPNDRDEDELFGTTTAAKRGNQRYVLPTTGQAIRQQRPRILVAGETPSVVANPAQLRAYAHTIEQIDQSQPAATFTSTSATYSRPFLQPAADPDDAPMTATQEALPPAPGVEPPSPPPLFSLRSASRGDVFDNDVDELANEIEPTAPQGTAVQQRRRSRHPQQESETEQLRAKKWAETTKAFFDFIDQKALHVVEA